jgi:hypothetical protein
MEEIFFFQYHMHMSRSECMTLPVYERKWLVHRFIEQKEKEQKAMESAKKKGKK